MHWLLGVRTCKSPCFSALDVPEDTAHLARARCLWTAAASSSAWCMAAPLPPAGMRPSWTLAVGSDTPTAAAAAALRSTGCAAGPAELSAGADAFVGSEDARGWAADASGAEVVPLRGTPPVRFGKWLLPAPLKPLSLVCMAAGRLDRSSPSPRRRKGDPGNGAICGWHIILCMYGFGAGGLTAMRA